MSAGRHVKTKKLRPTRTTLYGLSGHWGHLGPPVLLVPSDFAVKAGRSLGSPVLDKPSMTVRMAVTASGR